MNTNKSNVSRRSFVKFAGLVSTGIASYLQFLQQNPKSLAKS